MADTMHTAQLWPPGDLLRRLIQFGHSLDFDFPENFGTAGCPSAMVRSPKSHIAFRFDLGFDTKRLDVLAWVRTTSWEYDGERTDLDTLPSVAVAGMARARRGRSGFRF